MSAQRTLAPAAPELIAQQLPVRCAIPEATVARLPVYLRALTTFAEHGVHTVSSSDLAATTGVGSAKLRKDLSHLGSYGTRGVGYEVGDLIAHIGAALGHGQSWPVVLVGAGHLGSSLAGYGGFAGRGFTVVALLDHDPARIGARIGPLVVEPVEQLAEIVRRRQVAIGVITTPAHAAQQVCDAFVAAGICSVLNFAPVVLAVPAGVDVRKVDLSNELQILSFHAARRAPSSQASA